MHVVVQWLIFISLIGRLSKMLRWVSVDVLFLVNVLYATAVFLNALASLWYFVADLEGKENSWLTSSGMDPCTGPQRMIVGKWTWR